MLWYTVGKTRQGYGIWAMRLEIQEQSIPFPAQTLFSPDTGGLIRSLLAVEEGELEAGQQHLATGIGLQISVRSMPKIRSLFCNS